MKSQPIEYVAIADEACLREAEDATEEVLAFITQVTADVTGIAQGAARAQALRHGADWDPAPYGAAHAFPALEALDFSRNGLSGRLPLWLGAAHIPSQTQTDHCAAAMPPACDARDMKGSAAQSLRRHGTGLNSLSVPEHPHLSAYPPST